MSAAAGPTPRALRFLVHDTDEERGGLIALRARAGGHIVALETGLDGVRHRLLTECWDALALEVLAGRVSSPFAVRDLASAMRRHGGTMPPAVIYVRDALLVRQAAIDALLDELVPTLERVHGQDPDRVVRAMERAASGRRPAAVAIRPDSAVPPGAPFRLPPRGALAQPSSVAASSPPSPSPASNWRR